MRDSPVSRRRSVVLVVAVVAVLAVAGATAMSGGRSGDHPSGEAVLNDTRERYANARTVVGTADVVVSNGTANATATVEFAAKGNRSRIVVTGENHTYRAGTNGTVAWYVAPNRSAAWELGTLRRRTAGPAAPSSRPGAAANRTVDGHENVTVEYLRAGRDDGTPAHVIRVRPANATGDRRATLWVARDDARLLRVETTDGTNATVVDYRRTRFNVSVHGSTFDPPTDRLAITTVERYDTFASVQANASLDLPRLDATFREAAVVTRPDDTSVAQEYRADGDNVTVVSTTVDREFDRSNATRVTVNGHAANVTTVRERAVVFWRTGGVTTAVVVDASEDRAVELARRLDESGRRG